MLMLVSVLGFFALATAQTLCPNPIPMSTNEEDAITLFPQRDMCLLITLTEFQRSTNHSAFFGYTVGSVVGNNPVGQARAVLYNANDSSVLGNVGPLSGAEAQAGLCLAGDSLPETVWYVFTSQADDNIYLNVQMSTTEEPVAECTKESFSPFLGCENPQSFPVNAESGVELNVTTAHSCWFVSLTQLQDQGPVTIGFTGLSGPFGSVEETVAGEDSKVLQLITMEESSNTTSWTAEAGELPLEFFLMFYSNATEPATITAFVSAPGATPSAPPPPVTQDNGDDGGLGWWWLVIVAVCVLVLVLIVVAVVFVVLKRRAAASSSSAYDDIADW